MPTQAAQLNTFVRRLNGSSVPLSAPVPVPHSVQLELFDTLQPRLEPFTYNVPGKLKQIALFIVFSRLSDKLTL